MPDALDTVKALAAEMRRTAQTLELEDPPRAKRVLERSDALHEVAQELEGCRKRLRPLSNEYGDLSDLPQEVIDQLNLSKVDELEQQMRDIIAAGGGQEVGIDQIIIELWRRHKVKGQERRFIMNKLYRMSTKGIISGVEGRKGVYMIPEKRPSPLASWDDDSEIPF